MPADHPFTSAAPLMRTYSALGILKSATQQPYPRIAFVPVGDYDRITHYWWNDPGHEDSSLSVFTLAPRDLQPGDEDLDHSASAQAEDEDYRKRADRAIGDWIERKHADWQASGGRLTLPYVYLPTGMSYRGDFIEVNDRLWELRRYMLIIKSDAPPPPNAYIAYFDGGCWYYIAGDDRISQKNFNLISLFLTVMAIPPANPPLTTSISIGGG
jgi:hypothetical protein